MASIVALSMCTPRWGADCRNSQKFGYGRVEEIEGNKLEIEFEKTGRKRVMDSFVTVEA